MPLPDGTGSAIEVGEQLDRLFLIFRPPFRLDDERWGSLFREYVLVCQKYPMKSIKHGVDYLLTNRKEKSLPTPAEITQAIGDAVDAERAAFAPPPKLDFRAELAQRNENLRQRRREIIDTFERNQIRLCAQAKTEGWDGLLHAAVRSAANILAQRDMKRVEGIDVIYPCDFPNIANVQGIEQVAIDQTEIARWRSYWIDEQKGAA